MVAPLVPEFESHFVLPIPWLKDLPLYSVRGTLQYVAAPLLVPARGSSCWWLLDRVWAALISTHMYDIFSTYTRVPGSVSIHNPRTVAPCYGELLALLVYLTSPSFYSQNCHVHLSCYMTITKHPGCQCAFVPHHCNIYTPKLKLHSFHFIDITKLLS